MGNEPIARVTWKPDEDFREKIRAVIQHLEHIRERSLKRKPLRQTATATWLHPYQVHLIKSLTNQDHWVDVLGYAIESRGDQFYRAQRIQDEVILVPIER